MAIPIRQESDFPTQDATTVTLEDGVAYCLAGNITMTKRFVSATGSASSFVSNGFNSTTVTYSGVGAMFSGVDASIELMNISIEPGALNDLCDYSSTSPLTNSVVMDKVQIGDCASFGKFNNLFVVLLDNCSSDDTTVI